MAVISSQITVGETDILEVDSNPAEGLGTSAPLGTVAIVQDESNEVGQLFQKTGPLDTDWVRLLDITQGDTRYYTREELNSLLNNNGITSETITITALMVSNKQLTLSSTPTDVRSIVVVPEGGPPQIPEIDFNLSDTNVITWLGLGLESTIEENDKILIYYQTSL